MKMGKKALIYIGVLLCVLSVNTTVYSQDITTEGKDFWFGFMENYDVDVITLEIYISAKDSTSGLITIPGANWKVDFFVDSNSTTHITVPTAAAMARNSGIIEDKAIHITTDEDVSVFALNSRALSADASVILPTPALGRTYYASSYVGIGFSRFSEVMAVATENETQIEITPTQTTLDGHIAGKPFTVSLDSGQLIQIKSSRDLTGTKLQAVGTCKPFATFSGNEWTNVGGCPPAQDHLYEQMFPVGAWGQRFATVPFKSRAGGDIFTIVASSDATTVKIEGVSPFEINEGKFRTVLISTPSIITSDKPIQIAQLSRSQNCDQLQGDPFMILLSPIEQSLKSITYNAPNVTVIEKVLYEYNNANKFSQ